MAYEKAEEILLRPEAEIGRPELLSLVQIHHAQVKESLILNVFFIGCIPVAFEKKKTQVTNSVEILVFTN